MIQIPVVGGVAYASVKELTFSWLSFSCAMASNVVCAARGVVVKGERQFKHITFHAYTFSSSYRYANTKKVLPCLN